MPRKGWPLAPAFGGCGLDGAWRSAEVCHQEIDGEVWPRCNFKPLVFSQFRTAVDTPNTNLPPGSWGANYNRAFGEWLVREKLDFDKGDRSRLFEVMDNLAAIEGWRMTLTLSERLRLNHPSTVRRKWKAATQPPPRTGERTPTLRDSVVGLSEENAAKDIEIAALRAGPAELEAAREQAPPAETPPATLLAASDHVMHLAAEDTAWPASGHALDGIESWLIYSDAHSVTKWLAHLLLERDDWGALLEAVRKSCEEESDQ